MSKSKVVKILLVEDSLTMVEMVKIWLNEVGLPFELVVSTCLHDAIEFLSEQTMDVIILDLNLPDSEGFDTFQSIQPHSNHCPIVIMSGESDEQLAIRAVRAGAQDYIVKRSFEGANPLGRPIRFAIERSARRESERALEVAQSQLSMAHAIQQEMLPQSSPGIDGFDVSGRCLPAETVAGDYFDYVRLTDGRWGVLIGDVCGHGLGPALLMVSTRGALRALMGVFTDPATIAAHANEVVSADTHSNGRFVTLMFMIIDPTTKSIRFAAGGHPAYLFGADGVLKKTLQSEHLPLGINATEDYHSYDAQLVEGDVVVLFTDGVNEAPSTDQIQFGYDRLFEVIAANIDKPAAEMVDAVFAAVAEFTRGDAPLDDLTVVIVKCLNSGA